MPRYPAAADRYAYRCSDCGTEIPAFQGLYWFTRERKCNDSTLDTPYCPECGSETIEREGYMSSR